MAAWEEVEVPEEVTVVKDEAADEAAAEDAGTVAAWEEVKVREEVTVIIELDWLPVFPEVCVVVVVRVAGAEEAATELAGAEEARAELEAAELEAAEEELV